MRTLIVILIFCASNLFGQKNANPINRAQSEFNKLIELTVKTDSIISESDKINNNEKYIVTSLSEGSIQLYDSLKVGTGLGGFSTYTYTNEKTKKIIKAEHKQTVHYKYDENDSLKGNTERLEISIYYEGEKPYFAIFNEYHYDNKNVISTNKYSLQLNERSDDIYYSNSFQKKIVKYILKLNKDILSQK